MCCARAAYERWYQLLLLTAERPRGFLRSQGITHASNGRPRVTPCQLYPNFMVFCMRQGIWVSICAFKLKRIAVDPPLSCPHLPLAVLCPVAPSIPAILPLPCSLVT